MLWNDNPKIRRRNCWINIKRKIHRTNFTQCRTVNVISFLNALSGTKSETDIDDLFKCTEGQALEQMVNATQWPIDTKITMNNTEALKAMIIWDELICKREKQLNAIRDALA